MWQSTDHLYNSPSHVYDESYTNGKEDNKISTTPPIVEIQAQPSATVIIRQEDIQKSTPNQLYTQSQCMVLRGMAIFQLMVGSLTILVGLICVGHASSGQTEYAALTGHISIGIWGGALFIVSGAFTIISTRDTSSCKVIACLGFNVISCLLASTLVILSAISIANNSTIKPLGGHEGDHDDILVTMEFLSLILGLAELLVTLVSTAICCSAAYCKFKPALATVVWRS